MTSKPEPSTATVLPSLRAPRWAQESMPAASPLAMTGPRAARAPDRFSATDRPHGGRLRARRRAECAEIGGRPPEDIRARGKAPEEPAGGRAGPPKQEFHGQPANRSV